MIQFYVGVDVGTTNTKALLLSTAGEIVTVKKWDTPKYIANGVEFISLKEIEIAMDNFIEEVSGLGKISGIAFTSIGESVVPVAKGKALSDPIIWHDRSSFDLWKENEAEIDLLAPYLKTGVDSNYTFSIHKINWMKQNLDLGDVESWLPVSSYMGYRLCGEPAWDFSQACRSYGIDIHERTWNSRLLDTIGESESTMGKLLYTGQFVGETSNGIPIFSAGHDHITGLFAIATLSGSGELIFDSMGSASVAAAILQEKENELHMECPFMARGTLGVAFKNRQYYLESNLRHYGRVLQWVMNTTGNAASPEAYDTLNLAIDSTTEIPTRPLFGVNGDLVFGESIRGINLFEAPLDLTPARLLQSAYVYLAASSKEIITNLESFTGKQLPIIASGGCTLNDTLMRYKASLLERSITILNTNEATALGAALAAASGAGDSNTVSNCKNLIPLKEIEPDMNLSKKLNVVANDIWKEYSELTKRAL